MSHLRSALLGAVCLLFGPICASAERFVLESSDDSVVGELRYTQARRDDTLIDIAREFDLGYDQIVSANRGINRWIPGEGTRVTLPQYHVLPDTPYRGLVLNIADLRLYYYPTPRVGYPQEVHTYPVSIGRMDWKTPLGITRIVKKERDPAWRPPPSIRKEHALDGDPLPEVIPGGSPDNPLGRFALRLGIPTYLIHGVDERKAFGIGMRVTHGCIRMYPEDIEHLFGLVSVNTPVLLVNEPIKLGQRGGGIFLSVHQPLDEGEDENVPPLPRISLDTVTRYVRSHLGANTTFDYDEVTKITEEGDGIPHQIAQGVLPHKRPLAEKTSTLVPERPRTRKALDREYEDAVARYLQELPEKKTEERARERLATKEVERGVREVPRRTPVAVTDTAEDDRVRRYLEERY